MKRLSIMLSSSFVVLSGILIAQDWTYNKLEILTLNATAVSFPLADVQEGNGHHQAESAVCFVSTVPARYNITGAAATATAGLRQTPGAYLPTIVTNNALRLFSAISESGATGELACILSGR